MKKKSEKFINGFAVNHSVTTEFNNTADDINFFGKAVLFCIKGAQWTYIACLSSTQEVHATVSRSESRFSVIF